MQTLESLGLNVPGFLWHLANFLLLAFLLTRYFYRPILRILDERAARVRQSMELAERTRREAEQAEAERAGLLAEARREAEEIRTQAERQASAYRAQRREEAEAEIQRILARAEADLEARKQQMLAEVTASLADLAVGAAEKLIRARLDGQDQRRLVEEFLAERAGSGGPH